LITAEEALGRADQKEIVRQHVQSAVRTRQPAVFNPS
jgi:hypothetical protein